MEEFRQAHRQRVREAEKLGEDLRFDEPLIQLDAPGVAYQEVSPTELAKAAAVYMTGVFVLCYALLPMITAQLGLFDGVLQGIVGNFRAFLIMLGMVVAGILVFKPRLRVPRFGNKADVDPWLAATSGSLLVWAVIHNVHPFLRHFVDMTGVELSTFLAMNIVESALFGMLLASLVRTRRAAFAVGAAFNTAFLTGALFFF